MSPESDEFEAEETVPPVSTDRSPANPAMPGRLAVEARHAMIELLARGSITKRSKPGVYAAFLRWREDIRTSLADLNLQVSVDDLFEVVVLLQHHEDGDEDYLPSLIRPRQLNLNETLVVLILRSYFREREVAGELQMFITLEQILDGLMPFKPLRNSSSAEERSVRSAMESLRDLGLVVALRNEDSRWEISPAIRTLIDLPWLERLRNDYQERISKGLPAKNTDA